MMPKRITDLEKFSLEHVWRPYQTLMGHERRLESPPVSLEETARLLSIDNYWSQCVLDRIRGIGFTFPRYVHHPLVDVVKAAQSSRPTPKGDDNGRE
jgi:hypothetical protein